MDLKIEEFKDSIGGFSPFTLKVRLSALAET